MSENIPEYRPAIRTEQMGVAIAAEMAQMVAVLLDTVARLSSERCGVYALRGHDCPLAARVEMLEVQASLLGQPLPDVQRSL